MHVKLFHKLFIAMVVASFATLILFAATTHWTMQRSFVRYLNDVRAAHLAELAETFAAYYREAGDWQSLASEPQSLRRALSIQLHAFRQRDDVSEHRGILIGRDFGLHGRPPGNGGPRHRRRPRHPPFTVYDTDYTPVFGRRPYDADMQTHPIKVDARTVGWIGMPPLARPATPPDRRFERRQVSVLAIGAGIAGILSILVAWITARRLARPIRRIGDAARALAGGEFETRLPAGGRDEIGQLADDFNILARTLHENESARRRWIADISHELRTPLAIMHGELEAVRDGVRSNDERLVDSLRLETDRMNRLIEDLYQLSRADIGAMEYEFKPLSLGALLTQALNRFAHRFEEAGIRYDYDIDSTVRINGDETRLGQLVENLFENCCRYVERPGRVWVSMQRQGDQVRIGIGDSGPGVPGNELGRLFDPLHRVEASRNRASGGAGLGLAICARIVHAHGGRIRAEAGALGGLEIIIELPCGEPA